MNKINYVARGLLLDKIRDSGIKYYGTMGIVSFLDRIFKLKKRQTDKPQFFNNTYDEFMFHIEKIKDWDENTILKMPQIDIENCDDEIFFRFLSETLQPQVRNDFRSYSEEKSKLLEIYNSVLCICDLKIAENGEIYPMLYKYTSFETGLKILESGKIRFSEPTDLNDPFDGQFPISVNNFDEDCNRFIDELANEKGFTEKEKTDFHTNMQDANYRKEVINNVIANVRRDFGISCFSRHSVSSVMWAHYADAHKGIVLKFDKLKDVDFFKDSFSINYTTNCPKFSDVKDIFFTDGGTLEKVLLGTKSSEWHYENEVRVIMRSKGDIPIKKIAITSVIFGCKVSDEEIDNFKRIAKENGWNHLEFSFASQENLDLKISDYKTT